MKIGVCANTSWYLYNFRKNLIVALRDKGHTVVAISPYDSHTSKLKALGVEWQPMKMHQTSQNPITEFRTLLHLARQIRSIAPDALLTFTIKCNVYAGLIRRRQAFLHVANISGMGESFTSRQSLTRWGTMRLYRLALRRTQRVFFQNAEDLSNFLRARIVPESVCQRLPGSGVDLKAFTPLPKPDESGRTTTIFLMFGRLLPAKGYGLFLDAAQQLHDRYQKRAEFWILGIPDASRAASAQLFDKIQEAHARRIVTYFPPTDAVVTILRQADVVVLPSEYNEGIPRCLLEALACGKPIITTDWRGCRETVDPGHNGFLIECGNVGALTEALEWCLSADSETLKTMGAASRQKAEREFDEARVISAYMHTITT